MSHPMATRVRTGPVPGSGPVRSKTGPTRPVLDHFFDRRRSVPGVFDKLSTQRRAVKGRAAVWQIAKRHACVRRPLLPVGLIAQQLRGLVWWAAGQGMNQPPEPAAAAYRTHKGRSFSLRRDHGGGGNQSEPPMQLSTAMSAVPFDCRRTAVLHGRRRSPLAAPFDRRSPCNTAPAVNKGSHRRRKCPWRCRRRRIMTSCSHSLA